MIRYTCTRTTHNYVYHIHAHIYRIYTILIYLTSIILVPHMYHTCTTNVRHIYHIRKTHAHVTYELHMYHIRITHITHVKLIYHTCVQHIQHTYYLLFHAYHSCITYTYTIRVPCTRATHT